MSHRPHRHANEHEQDAGNFSWRARLLAACTPLSLLLLGNCLPGEVDRAVLSSSILLIYGPILALLFMKRKLAVVRSSFKLLTVLIAGVIVYGGRLFIPTMSEWTISGSSLLGTMILHRPLLLSPMGLIHHLQFQRSRLLS